MTHALVDLGAFRHNIDVARSFLSSRTKILAMVKANAYGHGMREIAQEASRCGIDFFGVARLEEGIELREAGRQERILLVEIPRGDRAEEALRRDLDITVGSTDAVKELDSLAQRLACRGRLHVEVETGMGRTGVAADGAAELVREIAASPNLELAGVFTHLATADEADHSFALKQLALYTKVLREVEALGIHVPIRHVANSGGIMTLPETHFDMVRPGIMLYGYPPNESMAHRGLRPVLSLVSEVTFVKPVEAGVSISYGRRYVAPVPTKIATILIGYGDGYSRMLTNRGEVLIRGRRYPVVGTVCMDLVMVDMGSDAPVQVGDPVVLIGSDGVESITAWDIARKTGTIPYEVTCAVTARVGRKYINALQ